MIFYSKPLCKQLLDDELVPWRHYVPILDESSVDLLHNFRMLKADPDLAWRIARNGRNLASLCTTERRNPKNVVQGSFCIHQRNHGRCTKLGRSGARAGSATQLQSLVMIV